MHVPMPTGKKSKKDNEQNEPENDKWWQQITPYGLCTHDNYGLNYYLTNLSIL